MFFKLSGELVNERVIAKFYIVLGKDQGHGKPRGWQLRIEFSDGTFDMFVPYRKRRKTELVKEQIEKAMAAKQPIIDLDDLVGDKKFYYDYSDG